MLEEDPRLLFDDDVESGVEGMYRMWPQLTPDALANSCAVELCLAVRALSTSGPPRAM